MNNNLMNFEGHNVEVFEWNGQVLFNPRHVGECLELGKSAIRMAISKMNERQVVKLKNSKMVGFNFRRLNNAGENFLTELGIYSLLLKSQKTTSEYKLKFKNWLVSLGLVQDKFIIEDRKEIKFIDKLKETLKPFNYKCIPQFKVENYRIDLYIKDINVAIEYDENKHKKYTYDQQEGRQKKIENKLGCKFIRINDDKSDEYNIGLVIKTMVA